MAQHYTIHSATTGVKIESQGKQVVATKGAALKATDQLIIPNNGVVEVFNSLDKRIYRSLRPGKISVTKLMIEAREVASDNSKSVSAKMRFGKGSGAGNKNVYVEKGMVTRSLAMYDPASDGLEMDPATLAKYIRVKLLQPADTADLPIALTHGKTKEGGLSFRLENVLDYPVYFNILRLSPTATGDVAISELGQPDGTYVLLPHQVMQREHLAPLAADEAHILVLTPCKFDINSLLDEFGKQSAPGADLLNDLPAFIYTL